MTHAPTPVLAFEQVLIALLQPADRKLGRPIGAPQPRRRVDREYRRILTV
jgi:hypothetical protein